jgi:CTP:molybdopterin cytidylyltransferase MocA
MTPHILILAAGSSSRMRGADKLLELIDGEPQLRRAALAALATGCPVTVALPPDRPSRTDCLQGLGIKSVSVTDPAAGMAESLKAGLLTIPAEAPVLVLLADLPEITAEDLSACLGAWMSAPDRILRGTAADGRPGHPVGFPPDLRSEILALSGDHGAREVLACHKDRVFLVALPGRHATTDLDTPEDWALWRAGRPP